MTERYDRPSESDPAEEDAVEAGSTVVGVRAPSPVRRVLEDRVPWDVDPAPGWGMLALFGGVLAVVGVVDASIYLYPPSFGSPEWEFGTMAAVISAMPLPTIGFGGLTAWALARGSRRSRKWLGAVMLGMLVLIAVAYGFFLVRVPLALSAQVGPQGPAIIRALARTSVLAVGLGAGYLVAAIALLRNKETRRI